MERNGFGRKLLKYKSILLILKTMLSRFNTINLVLIVLALVGLALDIYDNGRIDYAAWIGAVVLFVGVINHFVNNYVPREEK